VDVANSDWATVGQAVFVGTGGDYEVQSKPSSTQVELKNLGYPANAAPATNIAFPQQVSPSGVRGPQGTSGASVTLDDISPTTTKGDIIVDNGANTPLASDVALGVGSDGKVLHADSAQATGLIWADIDLTGVASSLSGALPIANGGTGQVTQQAALDALAPATPATGDLIYYNGTHWVRFARGTALQLLRTNGAGTTLEWATASGLLQLVSSSTVTYATKTGVIPFNNSVPLNTAGDSLLTLSITPSSNTSRFVIEAFVNMGREDGSPGHFIMAFFDGSTCLAASSKYDGGDADDMNGVTSSYEYVPGSTAARTITLRTGFSSAGNYYINGSKAARRFGGVATSWLRVTEYA
jgi:hypothetical protein